MEDIEKMKAELLNQYEAFLKEKNEELERRENAFLVGLAQKAGESMISEFAKHLPKSNDKTDLLNNIIDELKEIRQILYLCQSDILTIKDASIYTGYSVQRLRKAVSNFELPHYRHGNKIVFDKSELQAWLKQTRISSYKEIDKEADEYIRNNSLPNGWPKKKRKK
jgi:excisionase family DNA binding protein